MALAALAATLVCAGCAPGPTLLIVDLRTDLVPGVEFAQAETILTQEGSVAGTTFPHAVAASEDYVAAVRVARFTVTMPGTVSIVVRLRTADGALVVERSVRAYVVSDRVVTVVVTRGCRGVTCPMAGDDADATACLGARCVSPDCFTESPESCGPAQCTTAADCAQTSTCARFECIDRVCLARTTPGACTAFEYCSVDRGCQPLGADCTPGSPCDTGNPCELGRLDCSTGAGVCLAMGPAPRGEPCRSARDGCDAPETCDGVSPTCPADALAPPGTPCSEGYCNGLGTCGACTSGAACSRGDPCQLGMTDCSTGAPVCVDAGPASAGTPCRAAAGDCDVAESCDGASTSCPLDTYLSSSTLCRSAADSCDLAELCTGVDASCPLDGLAAAGTECRPSMRPCDAPELCDGSTRACPGDAAPVAGCSTQLRTAGTTMFTVPVGCTSLRIRAWGAGGGYGRGNTVGGAGGYGEGVVDVTPGELLTVSVGGPGASTVSGTGGAGGAPGGGRGGAGGSAGGGGGGGYSGVFRGTVSQASALVMAGGGAGSGGGATSATGAGGGAVGGAGWSGAGGGTQTAGGAGAGGAGSGAALVGGAGAPRGGGDGGGGGGGGYFGGGGGASASTDAGGGGGGSAYAISSATGVVLTAGTGSTPGNASDPLRMSAAGERAAGAVLLDCL